MDDIDVRITRLAGLGDGEAEHAGRKLFVPCTTAGDKVRVRLGHGTKEVLYGQLQEVIEAGPDRAAPPCPHFTLCGGCSLQQLTPDAYRAFKQRMAEEAVRKAGFDTAVVEPLVILPAYTRRRAEFTAYQGVLGYYARRSHARVDIRECLLLEPQLLKAAFWLKQQSHAWDAPVDVLMNGVDGGYDALLTSPQRPLLSGALPPALLRISWRMQKEKPVYMAGHKEVYLQMGRASVPVPPGAFLQASREAQRLLCAWASEGVAGAGRVLDLFAGLGAYGFSLLETAHVTAVEGEASMVCAMQKAVRNAKINNYIAIQRDLFRHPFAASELNAFDGVIINPPRAGAQAQSRELAASQVRLVVMISCNPATFARDAQELRKGGYALSRLRPLDQFLYSAHLELVAEFTKN